MTTKKEAKIIRLKERRINLNSKPNQTLASVEADMINILDQIELNMDIDLKEKEAQI